MAFQAGSVVGQAILDSSGWTKGVNQVQSGNQGLKKGFQTLGKVAAAASAAIAAAIAKSVVEANKFNKEFANVSTLVDPAVVDLKTMKGELLGLDSRLGSARELTEGLYQAISASVEPTKAVEFVGEAAQFARAALVDTNTAVDVITTGLNAYGLEAGEAGRISDVLFTTIKNGKVTGEELSGTIGQVIPLAANMGLSFENLGASIAEMTKQGVSSAESTTQLNSVMTALLNPSEELQTAMEEAGFATGDAVTSSDNFQEALQKVIGQTDGSKEALAELFPNVRALRGALALTGDGASGFTDTLNEMNNASGATTTAFEKQEITFETLNNAVNKLFILIGERFLPVVLQSTGGIIALVEELASGGEAFDKLTDAISTGMAIFETIKTIVMELVDAAFSSLVEEAENIKEKLEELKSPGDDVNAVFQGVALTMNIAAAAVRIAIKSTSILIQGLIDMISVGKSVVTAFSTVWEVLKGEKDVSEIKDSFFEVGESYKEFYQNAASNGKELVDSFADEINTILTTQQETAEKLQTRAIEVAENTKNAIVENAAEIIETEQGKRDIIINFQNETGDNAKQNNDDIVKDTKSTTKETLKFWEKLYKDIISGADATLAKVKAQFNSFKSALGQIYSSLTSLVNMFYQNQIDAAEEGSEEQKKLLKEQFIANKAVSIIDATINTAVAATKALTAGPIIGPILAGIIAGLGAVQIALIASQPMPQFQAGTDDEFFQAPGNEDFVAAFNSDEVINVQDEEDVAEGGTGAQTLIVENMIDGEVIGKKIFQWTKNGIAQVSERALVAI